MIRIHRTQKVPAILAEKGNQQMKMDCSSFEQNPQGYLTGNLRFCDKHFYSRRMVKDALMKMHHQKCCYCETKLFTRAYLHVEHFRPKSAVRQSRDQKDEYPGYYWMLYTWENLLLACFECNSTHKGTLFPLEDPEKRARSHKDNISSENPLLIDPSKEDPREHIRFESGYPKGLTERGRRTINILKLRRTTLEEQRQERMEVVERLIDIIELVAAMSLDAQTAHEDKLRRAWDYIHKCKQPESAFSAMVMDLTAARGV